MNTLCVILARAGSKGLPGKNRRVLAGKPLVAWSIRHAQAAQGVARIVVSTDDPEIEIIAADCRVGVIRRPEALAGDAAPVDQAVRHAVAACESQDGCVYDAVVVLYANVPMRPDGLIDRALAKLASSGADSVQSVCPVGKFHPYWMKLLGGDDGDRLAPYQPNQVDRRQDLPPVYQLDGGIIVVKRDVLYNTAAGGPHAFLGSNRRAVVTRPGEVVDVDTALDFLVAEALMGHGSASSDRADSNVS